MPTAFRVTLKNVPGTLADLADALGERGINIEASGGETLGGEGRVTLLTADPKATREVLKGRNVPFEEVELLVITLQDNPGALGRIARRFAEAGINVTGLVQISRAQGRSDLGFVVSDLKKARSLVE